jgi:transposase-like protein
MSKKNQFNAAEKLAILQQLELGEDTRVGVAQKYGISVTTAAFL